MPFRQLRYFSAVAQHGNFGRAAEAIGVAQSALSRHVLDLERSIGAPLFERTPRGVHLTPVGRLFLADVNRLLAQLDESFDQARRAAAGQSGRLTLGLNDLAERTPAVTHALAGFRARFPDIALDLRSMSSHVQLEELRHRRIDAGLMIERSVEATGFDHLHVASDPFVLAMRGDHDLATASAISSALLHAEPFVGLSMKRHWLAQSRLLAHCRAIGFQPRFVLDAESERLQLSLVSRGVGLALVNASAIHALPDGVVLRPVDDLDIALHLDLTWRSGEHNAGLARFVALLESHVGPGAGGR